MSEPVVAGASEKRADGLSGLGRVLISVYIVLALAATFRSIYQIATKFDEAPLAYVLSAIAGVVYIAAAVALILRAKPAWRAVAWAALSFELAGVLVVGTLSLVMPQLFAHPSVWSIFGQGYVFIPLVLPVLGLIWLFRDRTQRQRDRIQRQREDAARRQAGNPSEMTEGSCAP